MEKYGITALVHYLDDFFGCAPSRQSCQEKVDLILGAFRFLGVPIAEDKLEGPPVQLVFLGIEIDSQTMGCRLPQVISVRHHINMGESPKMPKMRIAFSHWFFVICLPLH